MDKVELDPATRRVRFLRAGLRLDLGAIGKGYAVDCAVEVVREAGVASALIHGGTSSVYGLGRMPDGRPWKVAIPEPQAAAQTSENDPETPERALAEFTLEDASLGVSAVWGRTLVRGGSELGHVLDPRTGEPVQRAALAAVALPEATESDALSTALLVLGAEGVEVLRRFQPGLRALVWPPGDPSATPMGRG
jgi:thiamine biosynthesis lipoprotein